MASKFLVQGLLAPLLRFQDKQDYHGDEECGGDFSTHGGLEKKRERQKGTWDKMLFQSTHPLTYFLQLGPASYHLLKMPSNMNPSMGQSII
jgi:hypothetical protein